MTNEAGRERARAAAAAVRTGMSDKLGSLWWAFLLRGAFAIALGLFALFWTGSGLAVISWGIGIAAILFGALLLYIGSRFRRLGVRFDTSVGR